MYPALLTNRYLSTRVIPLIAVAAVALCVALVIIVVSVMTGFLDMVKNSGRKLMGDVVIAYPVSGIGHYERLIERLEALPNVTAATPLVDGIGLLRMPYPMGRRKETEMVQFWAIEAESFAKVTGYADTLYWKPPTADEARTMPKEDFRRELLRVIGEEGLAEVYHDGLTLSAAPGEINAPPPRSRIVLGMHISVGNTRTSEGSYEPIEGPDGFWWMPRYEVVLTVLPADTAATSPEPESETFQIANEFVSGVFLIDDKRVIVPLAVGQKLMHLDSAKILDDDGEIVGTDPARVTQILVRAADGVTPDALRDEVDLAYEAFVEELAADLTVHPETIPPPRWRGVSIQTWLQQQASFIAPVEKERELMRILFSIIYLVCAGLVLSIFWAIVYEKTRDIGILRSVGASRAGITYIFLRYGAVIGVVGAVLGLGIAWLVVSNINRIHSAMGEEAPRWLWIGGFVLAAIALVITFWRATKGQLLPVVLWSILTIALTGVAVALMFHKGTLIWDPSVYYFTEIPNELDPVAAVTTMIGAVVFSVLGAFIPAAKAADTDPVKALRYE